MPNYDEIDEELAKEFPDLFQTKETNDPEVIDLSEDEQIDEVEPEVTTQQGETGGTEIDHTNEETPENKDRKPSAPRESENEKANRAFAQLRREKKEAQETLDELAKLYNYKDTESLRQAVKQAKLKKEAEAKGVDPKFYEEFSEMKQKFTETEERERYLLKQRDAQRFQSTLKGVIQKFGLTEKDEATLFSRLEEDGYSLEDVLQVKNYERLITGTMSDIIISKSAKPEKTQVDDTGIRSSRVSQKSIDELLDEEMRDYAKKRGLTM